MAKKLSKEEWERRIKEVGVGRYEFVRWAVDGEFSALKKCVVRCVKDGHRWMTKANDLVNNMNGCPKCAGNIRLTNEERIEQINSLENIEFISWVGEYKNCYSRANVKCTVDGHKWNATVNSLTTGRTGCRKCAGKIRWTEAERIEQINKLENIKFISWLDGYKDTCSKANVKCEIDGFDWAASVSNLVNKGSGCPKCAKHGYDKSKLGFMYALRSECGKYIKIGISNNPKRRNKELERETPFKFNIVEQFEDDGAKIAELEKYFHDKYESAGFTGFGGATEWLVCTTQLLEELRTIGDRCGV